MKFLIKSYLFLIKFFQKYRIQPKGVNIPDEISEDELIVRGIVRPLFYSKKKITDNAFLPARGDRRTDVSVLRHDFTNADYCKHHIKNKVSIKNNEYCGLAILLARSVEEVNMASGDLKFEDGERLTVRIKSTPMENLEMHADILYSRGVVEDEPNTLLRKIAKALIKKYKYLQDPNPEKIEWCGEIISHNLL